MDMQYPLAKRQGVRSSPVSIPRPGRSHRQISPGQDAGTPNAPLISMLGGLMAFVPRRKAPRFYCEWIGPRPPSLSRTGEGDQTVVLYGGAVLKDCRIDRFLAS